MELLIKENINNEYGKIVNMNSLFAKIMIGLGKAENKPAGAKIKDLYWCSLGDISDSSKILKRGEQPKKSYKVCGIYYNIMQKENYEGGGDIFSFNDGISIKHMFEKIDKNLNEYNRYVHYVVSAKPLKSILKQNRLWCKDWDEETYLTAWIIDTLNHELKKLYAKNEYVSKEIIV